MNTRLKASILLGLKAAGAFHLCRRLRRRELRILCYHGISLGDEHLLDPVLFMRPETLRRRVKLLRKWGMSVLPLDEAVRKLADGSHPDHAVAITFDDGWHSTLEGARILNEAGLPSTVYVSTYYCRNQVPVFNVITRYLYWKKGHGHSAECEAMLQKAIPLDIAGETALLHEIAARLGIDAAPLERSRRFHNMTDAEMRALRGLGMDVQLHTHRHVFPKDEAGATAEIAANRAALAGVGAGPYVHFCYPSGIYDRSQFPWLEKLGLKSATTTRSGFNTPGTPRYELDRILDSDTMTDLEFEAELCGVMDWLRARR